jgi:CRISPR system Cascade subunit CasC
MAERLAQADYSQKKWFDSAIEGWQQERGGLRSRGDLSPEIQLFGRMITARKYYGNVDSPLQVAHAFTTHEALSERDYWIGADDLLNRAEGETGGGMIDVRRFGAGVFYQYTCLDVNLLRENLEKSFINLDAGQREALLLDMVTALIWAFAVQNPTGYQNSFASHAIADTLIAEVGGAFPHSAASAFEKPVERERNKAGYLEASRKALQVWDAARKQKYGAAVFPAMYSVGLQDNDGTMDALLDWVRKQLSRQE